jgi:dTDP-4-amino-4,6-dideoxygalactose transaminase
MAVNSFRIPTSQAKAYSNLEAPGTGHEPELVKDAFAPDRIALLGPHVDAFEREFAAAVGVPCASGKAG